MFFIISIVSLILLSLAGNSVFYLSVNKAIRKKWVFRTIWGIETVGIALLPALLIALIYFTGLSTDSRIFMWGVFTTLLFIIPLVFFMLYAFVAIFPFRKFSHIRRITTGIGWSLMLVIAGFILYGGFIGRKKIIIERINIVSNRLPESFSGFKIAQISDFHLGSLRHNPDYIEAVIDSINRLNPDVIFFTGDLVNSKAEEAEPFTSILKKLHAPYGVYSVMGNHDYAFYNHWNNEQDRLDNVARLMELERNSGWNLLNNDHHLLNRGKDTIAIVGVENWGEKRFGQQGDLTKAMTGISKGLFTLLLSHNPVHWREEVIPSSNIDITFSGHTHAMQIQFCNFSPSSWLYRDWSGLYKDENQYLYVNRGIGFVVFPARIGAYPEISLIELRYK